MRSLQQGAAEVIEMEVDDLELLAIGRPGTQEVDLLLYDPMPGGSGLLAQLLQRWAEVTQAARQIVAGCVSGCGSACVDCLLRFRNAFYHRYLNRHVADEALQAWGDRLEPSHAIPARLPDAQPADLTVTHSAQLMKVLLERAGFSGFVEEQPIELGRALGRTIPDFFFEDPNGNYEGICIYVDGMSGHIHGNPETRARDRQLREELRGRFYEVFEVTYQQLHDRGAMQRVFFRLGRILRGRAEAQALKDEMGWFDGAVPGERGAGEVA